ncbi:ras-related protein Rab-10-like [Liolophura sinensis]|uniref:ras-related protein Rab-10-like n=1 Tax=Liolophura sinensis TaxID=3198878 RepID=UPI003158D575
MYDVTNEDSFSSLPRWLRDVNENSTEDICKLIVGNKIDLSTKRCVSKERAKQFAEFHQIEYHEISCRENTNVDEALAILARRIKEKFELKSTLSRQKDITLTAPPKTKSSFKCPCI